MVKFHQSPQSSATRVINRPKANANNPSSCKVNNRNEVFASNTSVSMEAMRNIIDKAPVPKINVNCR